jgi:hypothetical protein
MSDSEITPKDSWGGRRHGAGRKKRTLIRPQVPVGCLSTTRRTAIAAALDQAHFQARLPDTAYASSIYRAVTAGKIRHVCCLSSSTECDDDGKLLTVRRANLVAINLLLVASAHRPETWIMPGGPQADARIVTETAAAARRTYWALDDHVSRKQIIAELSKDTDAEAQKIVQQLSASAPLAAAVVRR